MLAFVKAEDRHLFVLVENEQLQCPSQQLLLCWQQFHSWCSSGHTCDHWHLGRGFLAKQTPLVIILAHSQYCVSLSLRVSRISFSSETTVEEENLDGIIFGDIKIIGVFDEIKFGGYVMLQSLTQTPN